MSEMFELLARPDLDSPALVVALEGWIDAGYAGITAMNTIRDHTDMETVAVFDTDELLDHRARRPTLHLMDGVNTGLTWPIIELRAGVDRRGKDTLFLIGVEPDHTWRAFARAVVDLALEFGVRLVVPLGAYPAPIPHTRPTRVVSTATERDLAQHVGFVPGQIEVPAGVSAAIERRCADVGLPAVGLWAQVPHYASAMPYPSAAASLVDALEHVADLRFPTGDLLEEAADTRRRLDALVADSPEHLELVHQLELQVDAEARGERGEDGEPIEAVSGDELAAELEQYLREQGS